MASETSFENSDFSAATFPGCGFNKVSDEKEELEGKPKCSFVMIERHHNPFSSCARWLQYPGVLWLACLVSICAQTMCELILVGLFSSSEGRGTYYTIGLVAICWAIWNYGNKVTFEFKTLKTLFEVVFYLCFF